LVHHPPHLLAVSFDQPVKFCWPFCVDSKKIDKLKRGLADRVAGYQEYDDRKSDYTRKLGKRCDMDIPAKRSYVDSLKPGGQRWWIIETALTKVSRQERVSFIAELMTDGLYRTALQMPLTAAWGINYVVVQHMSAEASRWVQGAIGDREEVRTKCLALLEVIAHDALDNGDRRSAVAAVRTVADIAGLITSKTELSGPNGGPIAIQDLAKLSNDELEEAIVRAAAAAIRANGGAKDAASEAVMVAEQRILENKFSDPSMTPRNRGRPKATPVPAIGTTTAETTVADGNQSDESLSE